MQTTGNDADNNNADNEAADNDASDNDTADNAVMQKTDDDVGQEVVA